MCFFLILVVGIILPSPFVHQFNIVDFLLETSIVCSVTNSSGGVFWLKDLKIWFPVDVTSVPFLYNLIITDDLPFLSQ